MPKRKTSDVGLVRESSPRRSKRQRAESESAALGSLQHVSADAMMHIAQFLDSAERVRVLVTTSRAVSRRYLPSTTALNRDYGPKRHWDRNLFLQMVRLNAERKPHRKRACGECEHKTRLFHFCELEGVVCFGCWDTKRRGFLFGGAARKVYGFDQGELHQLSGGPRPFRYLLRDLDALALRVYGPSALQALAHPRKPFTPAAVRHFARNFPAATARPPPGRTPSPSGQRCPRTMLLVDSPASIARAQRALAGVAEVALQCHGARLGRMGRVALVAMATGPWRLVFDAATCADVWPFLRRVLQDDNIVKVVHDATLAADALQHQHGVALCNVHDTQAWHAQLDDVPCHEPSPSAAESLQRYGVTPRGPPPRPFRYDPAVWAERPLAVDTLRGATHVVSKLTRLRERQVVAASAEQARQARALSSERLEAARACHATEVVLGPDDARALAGPRNRNLLAVGSATDTLIVRQDASSFVIYAKTRADLVRARNVCRDQKNVNFNLNTI